MSGQLWEFLLTKIDVCAASFHCIHVVSVLPSHFERSSPDQVALRAAIVA